MSHAATPKTPPPPEYTPPLQISAENIASDEIFSKADQPIALSKPTRAMLDKLKTRCETYIKCLSDTWYLDISKFKHRDPFNRNGLFQEVGFMLTMSEKWTRLVIQMGRGKHEDKLGKVQSKHVKVLVEKLKGALKKEVDALEWLLGQLNGRKEVGGVWEGFYHDVGLLMQIAEQEIEEIFRILNEMIEEGKIEQSGKSGEYRQVGVMGQKVSALNLMDAPEAEHVKGVHLGVEDGLLSPKSNVAQTEIYPRPHDRQPMPFDKHPVESKKRPAEDEENEERPIHKKARRIYMPTPGQWECGICGWWSSGPWCTRQDRRRNSVCKGRREANSKSV